MPRESETGGPFNLPLDQHMSLSTTPESIMDEGQQYINEVLNNALDTDSESEAIKFLKTAQLWRQTMAAPYVENQWQNFKEKLKQAWETSAEPRKKVLRKIRMFLVDWENTTATEVADDDLKKTQEPSPRPSSEPIHEIPPTIAPIKTSAPTTAKDTPTTTLPTAHSELDEDFFQPNRPINQTEYSAVQLVEKEDQQQKFLKDTLRRQAAVIMGKENKNSQERGEDWYDVYEYLSEALFETATIDKAQEKIWLANQRLNNSKLPYTVLVENAIRRHPRFNLDIAKKQLIIDFLKSWGSSKELNPVVAPQTVPPTPKLSDSPAAFLPAKTGWGQIIKKRWQGLAAGATALLAATFGVGSHEMPKQIKDEDNQSALTAADNPNFISPAETATETPKVLTPNTILPPIEKLPKSYTKEEVAEIIKDMPLVSLVTKEKKPVTGVRSSDLNYKPNKSKSAKPVETVKDHRWLDIKPTGLTVKALKEALEPLSPHARDLIDLTANNDASPQTKKSLPRKPKPLSNYKLNRNA